MNPPVTSGDGGFYPQAKEELGLLLYNHSGKNDESASSKLATVVKKVIAISLMVLGSLVVLASAVTLVFAEMFPFNLILIPCCVGGFLVGIFLSMSGIALLPKFKPTSNLASHFIDNKNNA